MCAELCLFDGADGRVDPDEFARNKHKEYTELNHFIYLKKELWL